MGLVAMKVLGQISWLQFCPRHLEMKVDQVGTLELVVRFCRIPCEYPSQVGQDLEMKPLGLGLLEA